MSHTNGHDDPLQAIKDIVDDSTILIALAGAAVAFLTSFVPFSPVLGGLLAGWLVRNDKSRGAIVGGLSGFIVALPIGFIALPTFGLAFFDAATGFFFFIIALVFIAFGLLYTAGLAALGGYLGVLFYQRRLENASTATHASTGTTTHDGAHGNTESDQHGDDAWGTDDRFGDEN